MKALVSAILAAIVGALSKWALGRLKKPEPSAPTPEAQAATAAANLEVEKTTNAMVSTAVLATRQSDERLAAHPDQLRDPDPDSRD